MTILVENTLAGQAGTRPSNATLAGSGTAGTVTIAAAGTARYDTAHTIYDRPSIRIDSFRHRAGTARLSIPVPASGPWVARWYVWHPLTQAAGFGGDEVRWHVASASGPALLTIESGAGNLYGYMQPGTDLAATPTSPSASGPTHRVDSGWLRCELRSNGGLTRELRIYTGHETTGPRVLTWTNAGLGGGRLDLTGYRYRRRATLYWGNQGSDVTVYQQELIRLGYDLGPAGADGHFGDATHYATIAFQQAAGLSPTDGIPGPETRAAIDYELGLRPPPLWVSHLAVSDGAWIGPAAPPVAPARSRLIVGLPL